MRINNSAAVLQAAIEGHGFALARSVMARDDLAGGGLLRRLFPEIGAAAALACYVVQRPGCVNLPRLLAFRERLMNEVSAPDQQTGQAQASASRIAAT